MPLVRVLRMDTTSSTPADTADISMNVMPNSQKSEPGPGEKAALLNGVYMNQPLSGEIPKNRLEIKMMPPNR